MQKETDKGKALDVIVKNILTLLLADEEVKNMGRNFIEDMPECFYTEELTLLYVDSIIGDISEYPSHALLLLPSKWDRGLFLQANCLLLTESYQKLGCEYLEKLSMFQGIAFQDKNYIARNDKVRLITAYNFINRLVIEHFSEGQDHNFPDIVELSLGKAIERFCFLNLAVHEQNHFIYFLMKYNKFDIDNHNFPMCKKVFAASFNHFIEVKKNLDFSNRLKRPRTSVYTTLEDIDLMTGQQFEHFIAKLFLNMGYTTEVTQSSGDQGIDVIVSKDGKKIGIQAKCYSSSVGNSAIQEVVAGRAHYKLDRVMVVTNNFFTDAAKKLAQSNAVIMWDRSVLKEKIIIIDEKKNDVRITWNEYGQYPVEQYFFPDEKTGLAMVWNEKGNKVYETNYLDGKKNGLETSWYENGQKESETNYIDGYCNNGIETSWYENGQKKSEINYIDGKKNGLETSWYENGQKKSEINYIDGKKNGLEKMWYENESSWYEKGTRIETNYIDGKKNGLEKIWIKNGQKVCETNYIDDKKNGLEAQWDEKGLKRYEKYFIDDKLNGLETRWFENSRQKESETNYIDDVLNGLETRWYKNGQKESELNYIDGSPNGLQRLWYENGQKYPDYIWK